MDVKTWYYLGNGMQALAALHKTKLGIELSYVYCPYIGENQLKTKIKVLLEKLIYAYY